MHGETIMSSRAGTTPEYARDARSSGRALQAPPAPTPDGDPLTWPSTQRGFLAILLAYLVWTCNGAGLRRNAATRRIRGRNDLRRLAPASQMLSDP